jgi:signal transduction histidine kinase
MRLVRRLTLYLLLVIGTVVTVDTWLGVRDHLQLLEDDARHDERVLGRAFATAVEAEWRARGEEPALALIQEANRHQEGVEIRLVHLDAGRGDRFAPEIPGERLRAALGKQPVAQVRAEGERGTRLVTYVPIAIPDGRAVALEMSETLAHERTYPARRVRRTLAAAALTLLTCGAVAWVVGVQLVGRPVARLVEKARRIGAGDFSKPLLLSGRDEFSLLADELNAMAERLAAAARRVTAESAARIATLEQLRHADRLTTVGKLAAGLAHELGTPLNVISGRAQMIASGETADPDEAVACARIIEQQSERMTTIVRQLLDFARLRSPEKVPTDAGQLVRQIATLLEPFAAKRKVRLVCEEPASRLLAPLDGSQMQQALANLVVNAIQASNGPARVRVAAFPEPVAAGDAAGNAARRHAIFEVSDEGEGIPPDRLSAIFDPFFTTKDVGEGTGLGLSVAHGIVKEHGGWIEVQSEPGRGSRFRIFVPVEGA